MKRGSRAFWSAITLGPYAIGLAALSMSGCAGRSAAESIAECQSMQLFEAELRCIKADYDRHYPGGRGDGTRAESILLMSYGDALSDRVRKGTITDNEAKYQFRELMYRLRQQVRARDDARADRFAAMLSGLAIYNQSVQSPGRIVVCNRVGQSVICQ